MTAAEILTEANKRGVVLAVRDGQIVARPAGGLPPEIKAAARDRKVELIALLAGLPPDLPTDLHEQSDARDGVRADDSQAERIVQLDAERYERDRVAGRGYDVDSTVRIPENSSARTLIRLCREFGVALKLEPDGMMLVVRPWRSLLTALEAHVDDVAMLLAAEWNGDDA